MTGILIKNIIATGFGTTQQKITSLCVDENGLISALNTHETPAAGATVIDGKGAYLCPGWVDMHAHVWYGGTDLGVMMSQAGAARGVTIVVDAGSAGDGTFHGFREFICKPASTINQQVFSFLNVGSAGLAASKNTTELADFRSINFENFMDVVNANRDTILGIKIRASAEILHEWGMPPVIIAKKFSRITGLPLMCHIGEAPPTVEQVAAILEQGDIITHTYNGKVGGSLKEDPVLLEALREACTRGVFLDIGHGAASFSFDVFKYALEKDLKPHSISTDIHARNVNGAVRDMATTMAKILALGLSFDEVIAASTLTPRAMLGLPTENLLGVGKRADFTIFDVEQISEIVYDSQGSPLEINQSFEPRWAIMGNRAIEASRNKPTQRQKNQLNLQWGDGVCC